jgi:hypothetical protein
MRRNDRPAARNPIDDERQARPIPDRARVPSAARNALQIAEEGEMTITAAHLRAARELIGWSRARLAQLSKPENGIIADFEMDRRPLSHETNAAIVGALAAAGVEFERGQAVKLRGVCGEGVRAPKRRDEGQPRFGPQQASRLGQLLRNKPSRRPAFSWRGGVRSAPAIFWD